MSEQRLFSFRHPGEAGTKASHATNSDENFAVEAGDAFDLVESLQPGSIDTILTSPPYWGLRSYERTHNWAILKEWRTSGSDSSAIPSYDWYRQHGGVLGLEPFPEWYISHLVEFFEKARNCLKASGSLWVNVGDTYFARWSSIRDNGRQGLGDQARERRRTPMGGYRQEKQLLLVPARFAIAMQEQRWILRNDVIWYKPNIPPRPESDRLRLSHEHFFHFVKRPKAGRAKYYYNLRQVEPGATDVVTVCVSAGRNGHTATFPERLIRPRILSSCPPGGTLLDPFCGTGRALVVAMKEGRTAIGFDFSNAYVKAARELLASRRGG